MHHAMPHYGAKMKENFGVSACRCAALLSSCMEARVVTILSLGRWWLCKVQVPDVYLHVGCRNDCFSPACSSLRDSLIMEVAVARLPLRFSFQYRTYPIWSFRQVQTCTRIGTFLLQVRVTYRLAGLGRFPSAHHRSSRCSNRYNLEYEKGRFFAMVEKSF